MKIGIDASRAFIEKRTGTEEYSYQFIKNLTKVDTSSHQVFLYVKNNPEIDFNLPKNFVVKKICYNRLWTQIGLSLEMKKNAIDILFIPSHTVPIIHPKKTIATIHGLEFKYYPECYSIRERLFLELNTFLSVKWSSKIVVPSESTKKDLIRSYRIDPEKIKVIHHGVKIMNHESRIMNHDKESFNILFIGRLEKRKNLVNLIKAFEILNSKFNPLASELDSKLKLIIAGKEGFGFKEIKRAIKTSRYRDDIILKSYISEKEKERLYQNADVFVLPSFYEGFGLPALEAMSRNIPVICSKTSSLPEITGDAALLIRPNDPKEIAKAISRVFSDSDSREKMIKRGSRNVKKFSWEKCVKETMNTLLYC